MLGGLDCNRDPASTGNTIIFTLWIDYIIYIEAANISLLKHESVLYKHFDVFNNILSIVHIIYFVQKQFRGSSA